MLLKIDNREKKSRIKSCEKYFNTHGYSTAVETLPVGDYVFDDRICFEYKSAPDMIGSIKDGRVFRQAKTMKQYPYSFVIIVGSVPNEINKTNKKRYWSHYKGSFTVKSYIGAIARLETYSDVLVVENTQQAWELMESLVSKIYMDNVNIKMVDKPQSGLINPIASFLSCIYVSDAKRLPVKIALKIIDEFELKSLSDLLKLSYDDLISLDGVGRKTAIAVMNEIK